MRKNIIKNYSFDVGILIILFIFMIIFIDSILFIFNISISKINFIVALIFTFSFSIIYFVKKKNSIWDVIIKLLLFSILFLFSLFVARNTYDLSWDGNSYHKTAIGELKNGWNPLYERIEDFNSSEDNSLQLADTHDIWTNHYAKGQWIFAATIYDLTNNIESGKCINFLAIIAVLLIAFSYFISKISLLLSVIISFILALNPITIMQMFTYYNDLLVYSFIIIMLILMQNILDNKDKQINYIALFLTLCILINIKFTGLAYAGIMMLIYYIFILIKREYRINHLKEMTILGVTTVLIGIVLIGSSTYVKNTFTNGNPLYPLFGENKVDIMTTNQPQVFLEMNRIEKFIYANFSESINLTAFQNQNPVLKIPFTYKHDELLQLSIPDLRIGGFGVLFGGILLLSIVILLIGLYFLYFKDRKLFARFFIIVCTLTLLILILEESWWARYMPQIYIIPVLAILILYIFRKRKVNLILITFLIITTIINTGIIVKYNTIPNYERFVEIKENLKTLKNNNEMTVYTTDFNGAIYNIYDVNQNINVVNKLDENTSFKFYYNNMIYVLESEGQ